MTASVLLCPQCGAPVAPPSRFAVRATCTFCSTVVTIDPAVVRVQPYLDALARWEEASGSVVRLEGGAWKLLRPLARGTRTDLWHVERARTPTERGILKLSRGDDGDAAGAAEAAALKSLAATGAPAIGTLLPSLIASGRVLEGVHAGHHAVIVRAAPSFTADLAVAARQHPQGIDPAIAIWMWRRILEVLRILLEAGVSHDAIEPAHFVVERNQHGLRLVGFGHARLGATTAGPAVSASARMIRAVASSPPPGLDRLLTIASADPTLGASSAGILDLHRQIGDVARAEFGPPRFRPLALPN